MLEHDLMSTEFIVLGPVIPNAIIKQAHMTCKAPTKSWQQLKSQKLYLWKCRVLLNIAIWDVRTRCHVNRVGSPWSNYPKHTYKANSYDLHSPN